MKIATTVPTAIKLMISKMMLAFLSFIYFEVQVSGFRVLGSKFRVQGLRFRVQGSGLIINAGFQVSGARDLNTKVNLIT